MIIGTLLVKLHISDAHSLKEKRFVLKSLKDRVRQRFNVSLSEIGDHKDLWQTAELAIVAVSDEKRSLNALMDQALNYLSETPSVRITDSLLEFF